MREIKFRVWDGKERKMLPLTSLEMCTDGAMCVGYGYHFESMVGEDDVHPMQFTGLKDSKGVDIYEGDILRHDGWRENEDGVKILSDENRYDKYKVVEYQSTILFCGFNIPLDSEVIGNIYENPNLLEDIKGAA